MDRIALPQMNVFHSIELKWIAQFQQWAALRHPMSFISDYSVQFTWLFVVAAYCWTRSPLTRRMFIGYYFAHGFIHVAKAYFQMPRPFWISENIQAFGGSGGFGMPSGHVLITATVVSLFALEYKNRWVWVLALLAILAVSVSRVFLGVHFISDVLGAIIFSIFIAIVIRWRHSQANNEEHQVIFPEARLAWVLMVALLLAGWTLDVFEVGKASSHKWPQFTDSEFSWNGLIPWISALFGCAVLFQFGHCHATSLSADPPSIKLLQVFCCGACLYLIREVIRLAALPHGRFDLPQLIEISLSLLWTIVAIPSLFTWISSIRASSLRKKRYTICSDSSS